MRSSFTVLALCSDMLLFCAVIIGGNTTWGFLRMSYYFWTTHLGVELAACAVLVAASLLSLPVCWVVLLALQRPTLKLVPFYITLMCLVSSSLFLTGLGMSALAGATRSVHSPRLNASMTRALAGTNLDPMLYTSFSAMQTERNHTNHTKCSVPVYTKGCLYSAQAELGSFLSALSVYSASGIIVMAVTLFVAAYMLVTEKEDGGKLMPLRLAYLPSAPRAAPAPSPAPAPGLVPPPIYYV